MPIILENVVLSLGLLLWSCIFRHNHRLCLGTPKALQCPDCKPCPIPPQPCTLWVLSPAFHACSTHCQPLSVSPSVTLFACLPQLASGTGAFRS